MSMMQTHFHRQKKRDFCIKTEKHTGILTINVPLFLEVRDFMFFSTKKHKIPNF
jgi:hypothetical protein